MMRGGRSGISGKISRRVKGDQYLFTKIPGNILNSLNFQSYFLLTYQAGIEGVHVVTLLPEKVGVGDQWDHG